MFGIKLNLSVVFASAQLFQWIVTRSRKWSHLPHLQLLLDRNTSTGRRNEIPNNPVRFKLRFRNAEVII